MATIFQGPQIGITDCLTYQDIVNNYDGSVIENNDGSVSVYINDGNGLRPVVLSKTCCEYLNDEYYFDILSQECRWSNKITCKLADTFKINLNPKGNDGAIFYVDSGDNCALNIKFNYLIKITCDSLLEILNSGSTSNHNPNSQAIIDLQNQLIVETNNCDYQHSHLDELTEAYNSTLYSIVCEEVASTGPIFPTSSTEISTPKSAFGTSPLFGLSNTQLPGQIYCLTEPDGLNKWREILGETRYARFINGDQTSYSCADVQNIYEKNQALITNNIMGGPIRSQYLIECNTPANTKSDLLNEINATNQEILNCDSKINALNEQILVLQGQNSGSTCQTPIDFLESINAQLLLNIVNDDNSLSIVYSGALFNQIGSGNLYSYLTNNINSGFYVCNNNNNNNNNNGICSPILLTNTGTTIDNCSDVTTNLIESLFNEYSLSGGTLSGFTNSLPISSLASNWLTYDLTLVDENIINSIINKKIKFSLSVKNACGEFCLLVDNIEMNKICQHVENKNIFVTKSPGFTLDRIIDNKKSWLSKDDSSIREFKISNLNRSDDIRITNYDVNDDRLILNTKEIDLDINLASAIETDVWCYISDNNCLLNPISAITSGDCMTSCPSGYDLSPDMTECVRILTTQASLSGTPFMAFSGTQVNSYNDKGARFYEDITNKVFPLITSTGDTRTLDATGGTISVQVSNSVYSAITSTFWGDTPATAPVKGRLNNIGVWGTPATGGTQDPVNEWIGFTTCIDVEQTKTYYVGIAGDNNVRFKINGELIIEFTGISTNIFEFWHVFPISLNSGLNIIELQGKNNGSQASFGAEIYDPISFAALTGSTSTATTGTLFSTGNMVGQSLILSDSNGYSCPTGYSLDTCSFTGTGSTITCTMIDRIPSICVEPCTCFEGNLFNCCGDNIDFNKLLTQPISGITTIEDFEYYITSELIDVKNRKMISSYPTLKALYNRYLNSLDICGIDSLKFDYMKMDEFSNLVGDYWVDIIEQVVPATTIWGATKIYSNTLFDQQKYKYRSYSTLLCENPFSGQMVSSPINGTNGQTHIVDVEYKTLTNNGFSKPIISECNSISIAQMNFGSEFIGKVIITTQ